MKDEHNGNKQVCADDEEGPICAPFDANAISQTEEPWLPIETKLITVSVSIGVIAMIVLAILVHMFLLGG